MSVRVNLCEQEEAACKLIGTLEGPSETDDLKDPEAGAAPLTSL